MAEESEPSLGSLGMTDQRRWTEGSAAPYGADLELDHADNEPSIGADTAELDCCDEGEPKDYRPTEDEAIAARARSRIAERASGDALEYAAVDPETGRAGYCCRGTHNERP
jgi:hypothetical protein